MDVLFPHEKPRPAQEELMAEACGALERREHLVAHAPTGLGKTAGVLCPALTYALQTGRTAYFLTARHTQHAIALRTLSQVRERYNRKVTVVSVLGKKWMCAHEGADMLPGQEFHEYCRSQREGEQCIQYLNAKRRGPQYALGMEALLTAGPLPAEEVVRRSAAEKLCPYEMALGLAANAHVVIADYAYLFNPGIREAFLAKTGKRLEDAIIVCDEGHNLPERIREMLTHRLTSRMLRNGLKEAKRNRLDGAVAAMVEIQGCLNAIAQGMPEGGERLITRADLLDRIERFRKLPDLLTDLNLAADTVREHQRTSAIGGIAAFLDAWREEGPGFARVLRMDRDGLVATLRCLDPAVAAAPVLQAAHTVILMSGTLTPPEMYRDLLGFPAERTRCAAFPSPFPRENRLALVVPRTTTAYARRSGEQYRAIGLACAAIANAVPGCCALFFPSYAIRDAVRQHFEPHYRRAVLLEEPGMLKEAKEQLLSRLSGLKDAGAALLGVAAGSFGEGIDLPGVLRAVIVVGLPLDRPDLETKELIRYYDGKFGRGWEYGYTLPAITKILQNAGRAIRSEHDRGCLVFLDERYAMMRYLKCFPRDWNVTVAADPLEAIQAFFKNR
jgi:DNA excision repair protein ERCC-2